MKLIALLLISLVASARITTIQAIHSSYTRQLLDLEGDVKAKQDALADARKKLCLKEREVRKNYGVAERNSPRASTCDYILEGNKSDQYGNPVAYMATNALEKDQPFWYFTDNYEYLVKESQ